MDKVYNLNYLKEFSGDELFIKDIIETFIKESPQNYYKLKRHFVNRNFDEMKEIIHKFKNAATYIGNEKLLKELTDLEYNVSSDRDNMKIRTNISQIDLLVCDIVNKLKSDFNIR